MNCAMQKPHSKVGDRRITRREFSVRAAIAGATLSVAPALATSRTESVFQVGCYTRPWDKFDYRVALDGIAEAGFKYAGLMTAKGKSWVIINVDTSVEEVETIRKEVASRKLELLSIYGGEFPVAKSVEAGITGLRTLIDHCAICSCHNLLLGGTTDPILFDAYYKVVAECSAYAAAKRVGLSIKPHGGQNATGPDCRRIIQRVAQPNFRLWYDPGNILYYSDGKLDPADDSKTVDGLVVGMSVKDFLPPKEVLVTPGAGRVRFREVLSNLRAGGFTHGPLVIECVSVAADPAKITVEARKARVFIDDLLR
jgi:sugar phosphate isomerase/epimerase